MKPENLEIGKLYWMQVNNCEAIMMPQDLTTAIDQNFNILPAYEFKVYATTNSKWTNLFSTASLNSLNKVLIKEISKSDLILYVGWPVLTKFFTEDLQ